MDILSLVDAEAIATGLTIGLLSWLAGIPQKVFKHLRNWIRQRRICASSAAAMYDDATIRAAVNNYVRPKYSSVDPAEYQEPTAALLDARADLFSAMDSFIEKRNSDAKFLLVLADSGMGKTSFLINYFYSRTSPLWSRPDEFLLISLSDPDALERVRSLPKNRTKSTNLLLDAFDEDTKAIGRTHERLNEIVSESAGFRTITVSCRTQFFLSDENVPSGTGVSRIGAVPLRESKEHTFAKVYLSPFDNAQVDIYLRMTYPGLWGYRARKNAKEIVKKIPALSVRPMLLTHIPELIRSSRRIETAVDVYDEMVTAWAKRESAWIGEDALMRLSKELALDFYLHRASRGGEFASPSDILRIAKAMNVCEVGENVTARSLLNRNAAGMFKFAHRSIMEYFIADWILNDGGMNGVEITDQIAKFIAQRLRCSSAEVETFLTSCRILVSSESPSYSLGHPTNFCLFNSIPIWIDVEKFLAISTWSTTGYKLRMLERLSSFSHASGYADKTRLSRVRILFDVDPKLQDCKAFAICWFGALAVCGSFSISRLELIEAFGSSELFSSEFVIGGTSSTEGSDLSEFAWDIEKRNSCISSEASRAGDLSRLGANKSVSFEYSREDNTVLVRMIQGTWGTDGPLANHGILSSDAVIESLDGDYWLAKPITMNVTNRQLTLRH